MTRIKGKVFPSFENAHLPSRRQVRVYFKSHRSLTRQLRDMRTLAREVLDSKDVETILAGRRLIHLVSDEPNPEYSALHLMCSALKMSRETGVKWSLCMDTVVAKFEQQDKEPEDAPPAEGDHTRPSLGRLLRALISRTFRARHEKRAETNEHQRASAVDGESSSRSIADSEREIGRGVDEGCQDDHP